MRSFYLKKLTYSVISISNYNIHWLKNNQSNTC
nr:MAG TPA: hypothetical protein [Caudoviricetes sp.]